MFVEFHSKTPSIFIRSLLGSEPCMCQITEWSTNACASDACLPLGRRKAPAPAFGDKSAPAAAAHTQTVPDFFTGTRCTALHLMQHQKPAQFFMQGCCSTGCQKRMCSLIADANEVGNLLQAMQSERACRVTRHRFRDIFARWECI